MIFLDLEKAFELANPDVILDVLSKKGVSGKLLGWVKDFLEGRRAYVKFQGKQSADAPFSVGVPQGSILSPWLFNAIINEVILGCNQEKGFYTSAYADDLAFVNLIPVTQANPISMSVPGSNLF